MENKKHPEIALIMGYVLPGLGHFYLGKKEKGVFIMTLLLTTFALGFYLCDYGQVAIFEKNIPEQKKSFRPSFLAQAGIGVLAWLPAMYTKMEVVVPPESPRIVDPSHSLGLLYMMVAGLLNILVMQNAYETAQGKRRAKDNDIEQG